MNPAANQNGTTTITLTVSDGTLTAVDTFVLGITAVNDIPTMSDIADQTIAEDTSTAVLPFTIQDVETNLSCASVVKTTSNSSLIATGNIVIAGTAPNCTVQVTPLANQNGSSTITLTVTDASAATAQDSFVVTVTPDNDSPTISVIADQSTNEDTTLGGVAFTINDIDTSLSCATSVTPSSSNTTVLPVSNITLT